MARWPRIFMAVSALLASFIDCQSIEPSAPGQTPTVGAELLPGNNSSSQLASLTSLTLTAQVFINRIPGDLAITTTDNANNFTNANIAYISCDGSDYPGNIKGFQTIELVREKGAAAAILYSQQAETCHISVAGDLAGFPIFSMIGSQNATNLLNTVRNETADPAHAFMVMIASTGPRRDGDQPGGKSPSTAVAMIILYSITGVITALFLVIILTGAIRAHRHPERYGPRTESGRPRQGRAAGIARAMLDTIPIVKFGGNDNDNTPPKSTDVELGNANSAPRSSSDNPQATLPTEAATPPVAVARRPIVEEANGIAPASTTPTGQATSADPAGLECSICMNQFEKGEDVRVLPCDHKYHPACIDPWLLNSSGTCPLCRIDLRRKSTSEEEDGSGSNNQTSRELPPPLEEDPLVMGLGRSNRRSLRAHPGTQEERMAEARRLRESEGTQQIDAANTGDASNDSRRRRLTLRLRDRFGIRTHQAESR